MPKYTEQPEFEEFQSYWQGAARGDRRWSFWIEITLFVVVITTGANLLSDTLLLCSVIVLACFVVSYHLGLGLSSVEYKISLLINVIEWINDDRRSVD